MTFRIIDGKEKQALLDAAGGCETCGFCEPGLIAWQALGTKPTVSCEECLENLHPSDKGPRFAAAYLPELDLAAVSHYVRVSAFFAFATKTFGHGVYADDDALMPHAFARPSAWHAPLKYRTRAELFKGSVTPMKLKAAAQSVSAYEFLLGRVEAARTYYGSASPSDIIATIGADRFRESCRVIPLSIPVSRIRSWGHRDCSFMTLGFGAEPQTAGPRRIAENLHLNLDDVFDERDEHMLGGA